MHTQAFASIPLPLSLSLHPSLAGRLQAQSEWLDGGPEIWKVYYVGSPWRSTWLPATLALVSTHHQSSAWRSLLLPHLTSCGEQTAQLFVSRCSSQAIWGRKKGKGRMMEVGKKQQPSSRLPLPLTVRWFMTSFHLDTDVDGERRKPEVTQSGRASISTNLWGQFTVFRRKLQVFSERSVDLGNGARGYFAKIGEQRLSLSLNPGRQSYISGTEQRNWGRRGQFSHENPHI